MDLTERLLLRIHVFLESNPGKLTNEIPSHYIYKLAGYLIDDFTEFEESKKVK